MLSEIPAKQARELLGNEELFLDKWYAKYKDRLFDDIIEATSKGYNSIRLSADEWENDKSKKQYLFNRLDKLGYVIEVTSIMTIQW